MSSIDDRAGEAIPFAHGEVVIAAEESVEAEVFRGLGDSKQILEHVAKIEEVDPLNVRLTFTEEA